MKWFKHFSDALDDPFIQELLDEFKHSGYVAWFGLLEIIANENGNKLTGKLSVKPKYLKRKMRISITKLEEIYNFCASFVEEKSNKSERKVKLLFNKSEEKWNFECPKLLELKDNYLKDLQAPNKKPSNHKEVERRVKKNSKKEDIYKPENVSNQTWEDFLTHRKTLKAPITQTVINTFVKQAEKAGWTIEDALIESISRGWRGFKADWVNKNLGKNKKSYEDLKKEAEEKYGY